MKGLLIAIFAALMAAGTASAKMPLFAAKCTPGLNVDSSTDGKIYINGKSAKIIKRPDGQYTARAGGVWIDITPKGEQPPLVTYTARNKTTGTCEILSFKAPGGEAAANKEQPVGSASVSGLADTRWRLVEFQSMDDATGTTRPDDPSLYTMRLNADGTVTMRLSCNRAKGSWSAEPSSSGVSGRFKFGPLAATRALCPPPSMDESITAQAKYISSYLLKDGKLYLSLMADGGIYVWEPDTGSASTVDVPAAPEDGGPRDWEVMRALNLRQEPSTKARAIASYAPGTILDNLGCQRAEDRIWCDVQQLGGGPRGYVSAEYLKPAVSPDGSVAKGPDDSALRAGQGQFDATGTIPCAEHKGQPMGQCEFGVARAGGGYATVAVNKPDGRTRAIFFRMGKPIGADTSQADGYPEFSATKENDLNLISIGDERYEIPDAVVLGG